MKLKAKKKELQSGDVRLTFEGDVTIYTVVKLRKLLMKELKKVPGIELDLSKIGKFDTAGFQLFLHMKKLASSENKNVFIGKMSDTVARVFDLYGVNMRGNETT